MSKPYVPANVRTRIPRYMMSMLVTPSCWFIQCEIQPQHVYARFAQDGEISVFDAPVDQDTNACFGHVPLARHTGDLIDRPGEADVRVESAP
jgi:hypothetical protein